MRPLTGRGVARAGLGMSLLIALAVRLPHLRFVPIWDGRTYWDDCAQPALSGAFNPLAFNCFGHRSMLYMLGVTWPQYFSHGSALLLNLAHLVLSVVTIVAFYRIVARLFPPAEERSSGVEPALLTLLFASMPVWTASSINLNPDSGVLVAFVVALALLLERRIALAAIAGVFLVLSKEIGLLLWLVLTGSEALLTIMDHGWNRVAARTLARRAILLLPPAAYALAGIALQAQKLPTMWPVAAQQPSLIRTFLTLDYSDPHFGAYVADLFLLNFAWVMTVVIVAWLIAICVAVFRHRPLPLPALIDRRAGIMVALTTVATLYLLTRYPTFNNPRYLLPAFPMLVVAFGAGAVALIRRPAVRIALFVIAALLQLASMSRTVDPVSRLAFGTFPFGDHELLVMTSRTGECCGYGRDQLVYNMEYTAIHYLQDRLFATLRPGDGDVIGMARAAKWFVVGPLDAATRQRTLRATGVVRPQVTTLADIVAGTPLPERMLFIAYPNVDNRRDLRLLATAYAIAGPFQVEENGYRLDYFKLERLRRSPQSSPRALTPPARSVR